MKPSFHIALVLLPLSVVLGISAGCTQPKAAASHGKWLQDRIEETESIKIGMSRANLEKICRKDGGWKLRSPTTYILTSCPLIKLDVTFDGNTNVATVSKPYLGHPIWD